MGSACCVAAKDHTVSSRAASEAFHRNVLYSPSWSFRWDNRNRVAGEIESSAYQFSHGISSSASMEIKEPFSSGRANISEGGTPPENMGTPISQRSPIHDGGGANSMILSSDISQRSTYSVEVKNAEEYSEIASSPAPKISFSMTIPSYSSTPLADPLPQNSNAMPSNSTPSRQARRSPGHQLLRQISDSRILGMKSPCSNSMSEGRPSFVLSTCSNDFTNGSQGGFSDGWSMRTFSELVASSQRERWSFESEQLSSGHGKISGSSSRFLCSPSVDFQTCGVCTKLLMERASWRSNSVAAVAVLVCGHVYHADCLETMTQEVDKYDPACPICTVGEKQLLKLSKKAFKAEAEVKSRNYKKLKNRVVDSSCNGDLKFDEHRKGDEQGGKVPKLETSSSSRNPFSKPFLRRHFSFGSKWGRSLSENDSAKKKGFWLRCRKD